MTAVSYRSSVVVNSGDRATRITFRHIIAWLTERVSDLMVEFMGALYNLLQRFTKHYLLLDTLDFWPHYSTNWTVSQSQNYFTTGG
jgi:hypothetical protein